MSSYAMAHRNKLIGAVLVALIVGGVALYWHTRPMAAAHTLTLYGDVDIREVNAAFNDNGRISRLLCNPPESVDRMIFAGP